MKISSKERENERKISELAREIRALGGYAFILVPSDLLDIRQTENESYEKRKQILSILRDEEDVEEYYEKFAEHIRRIADDMPIDHDFKFPQ